MPRQSESLRLGGTLHDNAQQPPHLDARLLGAVGAGEEARGAEGQEILNTCVGEGVGVGVGCGGLFAGWCVYALCV